VDILKRYTGTAILSLDADLAGDMAARRGIEIAEKAGLLIKVINPKSETLNPKHFKDPGDFGGEDPEGWKKAVAGAVPIYDYYIDSAVERYGLEAEGKNKISKELVPIWAKIDDEIVKSHYVNKLAEVLGVEAQAVWTQIQKTLNSKSDDPNKSEISSSKTQVRTRREVVEEKLVKLAILGGKVKELAQSRAGKMIKGRFWQRVMEELTGGKEIKELPSEILGRVQELLMDETEFTEGEWEEIGKQLELVEIEEELGGAKADPARVRKLGSRKAELTKDR
jgi:DNA primase